MPEQLTLSQPAWVLLDMLQEQLGVTIEVLDVSMRPLVPIGVAEGPSATEEPQIAAEILKSLRTGEQRVDRTTGAAIGIFPLRVNRQVAGCLLVWVRTAGAEAAAGPDVEAAGQLVRTALEADLALHAQLSEARYRLRRAQGILRFLSQLGGDDTERGIMSAVIQAATVWFDVDCRIYARQPDESYDLVAMLPGIDQRTTGTRLDRARVEKLVSERRFPSAADFEDLGLTGRREDVLVLPVGSPTLPDWVLILVGSLEQEVELTFSAIARVLAAELLARESARLAFWQQHLAETGAEGRRAPERTLLMLLEGLVREVGGTAARVTLINGQAERVLAAAGTALPLSETTAPETTGEAAGPPAPLSLSVQIAPEYVVRLTLAPGGDRREAALQAASWMKALQPWLREVATGAAAQRVSAFEAAVEGAAFERRIQEEIERAKRFNLGLGLVLIGPGPGAAAADVEPLLAAIRSELRASDLLGRIRGGAVAVLLVHAEASGAGSVIARLRRRLGELPEAVRVKAVQLGQAVFSAEYGSAEALIAAALQQAQRLELRN